MCFQFFFFSGVYSLEMRKHKVTEILMSKSQRKDTNLQGFYLRIEKNSKKSPKVVIVGTVFLFLKIFNKERHGL